MPTLRAVRLSIAAVLAGALPAATQVRVGGEVEITPSQAYDKRHPAVAITRFGGSLVVWDEPGGVFGANLELEGAPFGEFEVDPNGSYPQVEFSDRGTTLIVWEDRSAAHHIYGKIIMVSFQPHFRVSQDFHVFLGFPQVGISRKSGRFAVAWGSDSDGVIVQRFSAAGTPLGPPLAVSGRFAEQAGIAMANSGRFVVSWTSLEGRKAWRFTRRGRPVGRPIGVGGTRLAMDAKGRFATVWEGGGGIWAECFNRAGRRRRGPFRVSTFVGGDQRDPAIAMDPKGRFVVVWESTGQDGDRRGVFGRLIRSDCRPAGPEFQVNTHTFDDQHDPAVAISPKGHFVVVWVSERQTHAGSGIFAQRFRR